MYKHIKKFLAGTVAALESISHPGLAASRNAATVMAYREKERRARQAAIDLGREIDDEQRLAAARVPLGKYASDEALKPVAEALKNLYPKDQVTDRPSRAFDLRFDDGGIEHHRTADDGRGGLRTFSVERMVYVIAADVDTAFRIADLVFERKLPTIYATKEAMLRSFDLYPAALRGRYRTFVVRIVKKDAATEKTSLPVNLPL